MASKRVLETSPEQNSPLIPGEDSENFKKPKSLTPVELPAILSDSQVQSTKDQENGPNYQDETVVVVEQSLQTFSHSKAHDGAIAKQENEPGRATDSSEKVLEAVENDSPVAVREEWEVNLRVGTEEFVAMMESETNITYNAPKCYKIRRNIGSGSYGSVVLAVDTRSKAMVAIKKLSHPFQTTIHARRTLRELRLAKQIKHPNIIPLLDLFVPHRNWAEFTSQELREKEEVYLVMHYGGRSLHERIQDNSLSAEDKKSILYQVICGTEYLHSIGVIHRDLKPFNIAVDDKGVACILDFGLARTSSDNASKTGYVVTRWYRAPELVYGLALTGTQAGNSRYDAAVDIFSIGAIMAEMQLRKPLFHLKDEAMFGAMEQFCAVLSVMGRPDDQTWLETVITDLFDREHIKQTFQAKSYPDLFGMFRGAPAQAFDGLDDEGVDLMIRMLNVNPRERLTASEARCHPYFHSIADRVGQVTVQSPPSPLTNPLQEEEDPGATTEQLKRMAL